MQSIVLGSEDDWKMIGQTVNDIIMEENMIRDEHVHYQVDEPMNIDIHLDDEGNILRDM